MSSAPIRLSLKLGLLFSITLFTAHCGSFKSSNALIQGIEGRISLDYDGPDEPTYCITPTVYSSAVTISGTASFEYRDIAYSSSFRGLGEVEETPKPIRRAEYVIINYVGAVVQCGETDATGGFSFTVPNDNQVYRLQIRSRADNTFVKASVLRSPESNQIYVLERAFTASSNQSFQLVAPATGSVLGGAFFILDEILNYNNRLRTLAGTCPAGVATGCVPFEVAPKVQIYWERGFNPGAYLPGSPASSFYYPNLQRLFLLGGINGDVDFSDTDHFDRSIIAHEYFHFLEDVYSRTSSPGGSHNGNQLIDPRLAWSEGVAQFFQAVMTNISRVLDTVGNIDGASQMIVDYSVEDGVNDLPNVEGEGEFREFSVARLLWDLHDDTPGETPLAGTDCATATAEDLANGRDACVRNNFIRFWSVLTGETGLNGTANYRFISSSLFVQLYDFVSNLGSSRENIVPLKNAEMQNYSIALREPAGETNLIHYAQPLVAGCGTPTTLKMQSPFVASQTAGLQNSHLSANNRYYYFYHGGGPLAVQINSTVTSSNGFQALTDIHLYPENYSAIGAPTLASNLTNAAVKSMASSSNLAAGFYMIVVSVKNFNSGTGTVNYTLRAGASTATLVNLCAAI